MLLYLLPLLFFVAPSAGQELVSALSVQTSLTKFTSFIKNYPALLTAANAGSVTVIAPNDKAFTEFFATSSASNNYSSSDEIEALLSYHILKAALSEFSISSTPRFPSTLLTNSSYTNVTTGQVVEAVTNNTVATFRSAVNQESRVIVPNIVFYGGFIHIVDSVLVPPTNLFATVTAAPLPYFIAVLGETVLSKTYYGALQNITDEMDTTFFAVNSKQFAQYLQANPEDDPQTLEENIEYVTIEGVHYSTDLNNGTKLKTALGKNVTITVLSGVMYVNDAKILRTDMLIANGVVHSIDKQLDPNDPNARPSPTSSAPASASSDSSRSRVSAGTAAGIGVGSALVVFIIIAAAIFLLRRRRRARRQQEKQRQQEQQGEQERTVPPYPAEKDAISPASRQHTQELSTKTGDRSELGGKSPVAEMDSRRPIQELDGQEVHKFDDNTTTTGSLGRSQH